MTRWPVQPLIDLGHTPHAISRAANVPRRRLLAHGLTDWQADRAAIRLGHYPSQIWPDWIDAALTEHDRDYLHTGWRQAWLWNQETA